MVRKTSKYKMPYLQSKLQVGDTTLSNDCTQRCTCENEATLSCSDAEACSNGEVCEIRHGVRGCYCKHGNYISNNGDCHGKFTIREAKSER